MLFNSFGFLFIFLPITTIGFFLLAKKSQFVAAGWLALASIVFYGWWDFHYIPLLFGSITFNYWSSWQISEAKSAKKKHWLIFSIGTNLALLGYYKYAGFFVSSITAIAGLSLESLQIILPIGISFFTFTQIAFLVDTYQGKVNERRFVHYVLFVTYFPHLIAGPVLHHKEMMPQFADAKKYRPQIITFAFGTAIFFIGLAKKVLIADNLSPFASQLFDHSTSPSLLSAWAGVLAYTFQLYFDFSGYSDMAIGLSRIFGVQLPLNFNSPYKATNISEFWRRWHMTLSRFLRDYLYIPLGGNRVGEYRRGLNLMTTMLLGGLWHGAGWNFVIWGGLHGLYLIVHQAWEKLGWASRLRIPSRLLAILATIITFTAVCIAWVFFRAPTLNGAMEVIQGMAGFNGLGMLPSMDSDPIQLKLVLDVWLAISIAAFLAFFMPNTQQIVARYLTQPITNDDLNGITTEIRFKAPHLIVPVLLGVIAALALMNLSRPSEFLYFNF